MENLEKAEMDIRILQDKTFNKTLEFNNKPPLVTHNPVNSDISDTMYDNFILSNFNFTLDNDVNIKFSQLDNCLNDIFNYSKEKNLEIKKYNFKKNKLVLLYIFAYDKTTKEVKFFINAGINSYYKNASFYLYTKDLDNLEGIYDIITKYEFNNSHSKIAFRQYSMTQQGLRVNNENMIYEDFNDINDKYYPYIDLKLFMDEFILGNENVLILCGEPGTGKSKFARLVMKKLLEEDKINKSDKYIKAFDQMINSENSENSDYIESNTIIEKTLDEILNNIEREENSGNQNDFSFYVASAKNVDLIASDDFWNEMKNMDLIILDDLDFLLSSRKENREDVIKNQFLSNFLSFTDGIHKRRTKVIITTNQPFESIDEALLRRGRLFAILEFRGLTEEEALEVWKTEGLYEDKFYEILENKNKIFKDGLITSSDLGQLIDSMKRNDKYLEKKDFILDESIDAISKAKKRRAGLI